MDEEKNNQDLTVGSDGAMKNENNPNNNNDPSDEAVKVESTNGITPPPVDETTSAPEAEPKVADQSPDDASNNTPDKPGAPDTPDTGEQIAVHKAPEEKTEGEDTASVENSSGTTKDNPTDSATSVESEANVSNEKLQPHEPAGNTTTPTDNLTTPSTSDTKADDAMTMPTEQPVSAPKESSPEKQPSSEAPHPHHNNRKFIAGIIVLVAILLSAALVYVYLSTQNNAAQAPAPTGQNETGSNQVQAATDEDVDKVVQELEEVLSELENTDDFSEATISDETLGL